LRECIKTAGMVLNGSRLSRLIITANSRKTITKALRSQVTDAVLEIVLVWRNSNEHTS